MVSASACEGSQSQRFDRLADASWLTPRTASGSEESILVHVTALGGDEKKFREVHKSPLQHLL